MIYLIHDHRSLSRCPDPGGTPLEMAKLLFGQMERTPGEYVSCRRQE